MKDSTKNVEWIFDDATFSKVFCVVLPVAVVQICTEADGEYVSLCWDAFHNLTFLFLPGGKSIKWKNKIATRHSRLRRTIFLSSIVNAQDNKFGRFK